MYWDLRTSFIWRMKLSWPYSLSPFLSYQVAFSKSFFSFQCFVIKIRLLFASSVNSITNPKFLTVCVYFFCVRVYTWAEKLDHIFFAGVHLNKKVSMTIRKHYAKMSGLWVSFRAGLNKWTKMKCREKGLRCYGTPFLKVCGTVPMNSLSSLLICWGIPNWSPVTMLRYLNDYISIKLP